MEEVSHNADPCGPGSTLLERIRTSNKKDRKICFVLLIQKETTINVILQNNFLKDTETHLILQLIETRENLRNVNKQCATIVFTIILRIEPTEACCFVFAKIFELKTEQFGFCAAQYIATVSHRAVWIICKCLCENTSMWKNNIYCKSVSNSTR